MLWLNHETQIKQAPDMAPEQASRAVAGQVDEDGVGLLIRLHPVASDLRQVISAMKVSNKPGAYR